MMSWLQGNGLVICMSEKRFRITTNPMSQSVAFDEKEKKYYIGIELEDLLNELAEENEQLREIINKLEEAIEKRGYDNIDEFW